MLARLGAAIPCLLLTLFVVQISILTATASGSSQINVPVAQVIVKDKTGDRVFDQKIGSKENHLILSSTPELDETQQLLIQFKALLQITKPTTDNNKDKVEASRVLDQAFIRFYNPNTHTEIIKPAQPYAASSSSSSKTKSDKDLQNSYRFILKKKSYKSEFSKSPGIYKISLILGSFDTNIGGIIKEIGDILISPIPKAHKQNQQSTVDTTSTDNDSRKPIDLQQIIHYGPKPLIAHTFKPQKHSPNILISLTFSGLCLVPVLGLFFGWSKFGNLNFELHNLQDPVYTGTFLVFIAGYVGLAIVYWIGMIKLFTTLWYVAVLSVPTFIVGQQALNRRILLNEENNITNTRNSSSSNKKPKKESSGGHY